jgi:hypothetical protein
MPGIVGPTIKDLLKVDFGGPKAIVATAFYSKTALQKVNVSASELDLMVRLDLNSVEEWKRGLIDPPALADFVEKHEKAGKSVNLFVHPIAHAKVYVGRKKFLVGSANLSTRGFSGVGHELLWESKQQNQHTEIRKSMRDYSDKFQALTLAELKSYVAIHHADVDTFKKNNPRRFAAFNEDRVDHLSPRATRYGDYEDFKIWLDSRPEIEAREILDRANGKNNLSGHIRANFFGLRQWMLADPAIQKFGRTVDADTYKFSADAAREARLKEFVETNAANEPGFSLSTWQAYLPKESGGSAKKHGGTIGNLNRMVPLMARYLP